MNELTLALHQDFDTKEIYKPLYELDKAISDIVMQTDFDSITSTTSDVTSEIDEKVRALPNLQLPSKNIPRPHPQWLQEWEGYIESITDDSFIGRLIDINNPDNPVEQAEFPISDISDDDRKLLKLGAVFRWLIGYEIAPGGTKSRKSLIIFRRIPALSPIDIEEADFEAEQLLAKIKCR